MSDGIIAPSFSAEALEILKAKKGGKYIVLQASRHAVITRKHHAVITRAIAGGRLVRAAGGRVPHHLRRNLPPAPRRRPGDLGDAINIGPPS